MRWRFLYDKNDVDYQRKMATTSLINSWWLEFEKKSKYLLDGFSAMEIDQVQEISDWVGEHLLAIDKNLKWECARSADDELLFVVTAEQNIELRSLVDAIIERAPKLNNWAFSSYRRGEQKELVEDAFEARTGVAGLGALRVHLEKTENNQIDLNYYSSKFSGDNDPADISDALVLTSIILGEEPLEKWIGAAWTYKEKRSVGKVVGSMLGAGTTNGAISLDQLPGSFAALHREIFSTLPDYPYSEVLILENGDWALIGPDTDQLTELPERIVYRTLTPSIVLAHLNSMYFFSECHSRFGEVFCSLKCELDNQLEDESVRDQFEETVDQRLRQEKLGCSVGAGLGPQHYFIDLALTDVDKAVPILRSLAADFGLPPNCWLLFWDTQWQEEWVGLHPETASPFH